MEHTNKPTAKESYDSLPEEEKLELVAFCLIEAIEKSGCKDTLARIEWVERILPEGAKHMAVQVYRDAAERRAAALSRSRMQRPSR